MDPDKLRRRIPTLRLLIEDKGAEPDEREAARRQLERDEATLQAVGYARPGNLHAVDLTRAHLSELFHDVFRPVFKVMQDVVVKAGNYNEHGDPARLNAPSWAFRSWPSGYIVAGEVEMRRSKFKDAPMWMWYCPECNDLVVIFAYPEARLVLKEIGPVLGLAAKRIAAGADAQLCYRCHEAYGGRTPTPEDEGWYQFQQRMREAEDIVPSQLVNALAEPAVFDPVNRPSVHSIASILSGLVENYRGCAPTKFNQDMLAKDMRKQLRMLTMQSIFAYRPVFDVVVGRRSSVLGVRWAGPVVDPKQQDVFA